MKKDGLLEALKASRLVIVNSPESLPSSTTKITNIRDSQLGTKTRSRTKKIDQSSTKPENTDEGITGSAAIKFDKGDFQAISDVRATDGSRGVPKSGRIWKRVKGRRLGQHNNVACSNQIMMSCHFLWLVGWQLLRRSFQLIQCWFQSQVMFIPLYIQIQFKV